MVPEPDSSVADGVRSRVADVLKSALERDLVSNLDAGDFAGHSDRVVTDYFEPDVRSQADGELLSGWDDEKFEKFAERLSELRDATGSR